MFDNLKDTKKQYSYAFSRLRKQEHCARNENMAEMIASNGNTDMWKEGKKLNGHRNNPPRIDGVKDSEIRCTIIIHVNSRTSVN